MRFNMKGDFSYYSKYFLTIGNNRKFIALTFQILKNSIMRNKYIKVTYVDRYMM